MPDAREQAEAVARWCGWTTDDDEKLWWHTPKGEVFIHDLPASLDAMREVEDLLAERGLLRRYREVLDAMWRADDVGMDRAEYLIRLTALQRLAAAARVIEEVEP